MILHLAFVPWAGLVIPLVMMPQSKGVPLARVAVMPKLPS
jgi:hypothetical protein